MTQPVVSYTSFSTNPRFVSFASTDADRQALISQIVADSACELAYRFLLHKWERAVYLKTAHMLTLIDEQQSALVDDGSGSGSGDSGSEFIFQGQITSISTGHGSESASIKPLEGTDRRSSRDEWLRQTPFGAELVLILNSVLMSGYVT